MHQLHVAGSRRPLTDRLLLSVHRGRASNANRPPATTRATTAIVLVWRKYAKQ